MFGNIKNLHEFINIMITWNQRRNPAGLVYGDSDMNTNFDTLPAPWLSLFLVLKGHLGFNVGGSRQIVKAGELVGINAHFGNAGRMQRQPVLYVCLSVDVGDHPEAARFAQAPMLVSGPVCDPTYLHRLCRMLCRLAHMPPDHFPDIQIHTALQQTLVAMYEAIPSTSEHVPAGRGRIVRETLRVIQERHSDSDLCLEAIAASVGVSVGHLEKRFRSEMSMTPMQLLSELRMARARALLLGTQSAIKDIAVSIGFRNPLYFSRVFSRSTGMSPRRFRNQARG